MQSVLLIGSEQVQSAGHSMQRAASEIDRSSQDMAEALRLHRCWMDDWLDRFCQAIARIEHPPTKGV